MPGTVAPNASSALVNARSSGDGSYDPLSAISLYFTSARSQVLVGTNLLPNMAAAVNPLLNEIAINQTTDFLATAAQDQALLTNASKCPQCLTSPFVLNPVDLIPFNSPVAVGAVTTGLIFVSQQKRT